MKEAITKEKMALSSELRANFKADAMAQQKEAEGAASAERLASKLKAEAELLKHQSSLKAQKERWEAINNKRKIEYEAAQKRLDNLQTLHSPEDPNSANYRKAHAFLAKVTQKAKIAVEHARKAYHHSTVQLSKVWQTMSNHADRNAAKKAAHYKGMKKKLQNQKAKMTTQSSRDRTMQKAYDATMAHAKHAELKARLNGRAVHAVKLLPGAMPALGGLGEDATADVTADVSVDVRGDVTQALSLSGKNSTSTCSDDVGWGHHCKELVDQCRKANSMKIHCRKTCFFCNSTVP